jgi:arylsulfatase A-like enzyme
VTKPNIVVIIADDLSRRCRPPRGAFPPNIDRIGRGRGVHQGYASAVCSPSRAGLMTGRHQQRFDTSTTTSAARDIGQRLGIDPRADPGRALRVAGTIPHPIGKSTWAPEFYPLNRGFDEFWGFLTSQTNFIAPDAPGAVTPGPSPVVGRANSSGLRCRQPGNAVITGPARGRSGWAMDS